MAAVCCSATHTGTCKVSCCREMNTNPRRRRYFNIYYIVEWTPKRKYGSVAVGRFWNEQLKRKQQILVTLQSQQKDH